MPYSAIRFMESFGVPSPYKSYFYSLFDNFILYVPSVYAYPICLHCTLVLYASFIYLDYILSLSTYLVYLLYILKDILLFFVSPRCEQVNVL